MLVLKIATTMLDIMLLVIIARSSIGISDQASKLGYSIMLVAILLSVILMWV